MQTTKEKSYATKLTKKGVNLIIVTAGYQTSASKTQVQRETAGSVTQYTDQWLHELGYITLYMEHDQKR